MLSHYIGNTFRKQFQLVGLAMVGRSACGWECTKDSQISNIVQCDKKEQQEMLSRKLMYTVHKLYQIMID